MTSPFSRHRTTAFALGLLMVLASGCTIAGGGYGYDDGIGLDYYEPSDGVYGGWGPNYRVGPLRDGGHFAGRGGGRPGPHAYRAAPASHAMPSIPSHSRGGGSHR
jgi:hypothetical protein